MQIKITYVTEVINIKKEDTIIGKKKVKSLDGLFVQPTPST
jgi:hypothetical protein